MATPATISYGSFNFLGNSGYPLPAVSISKDYQRNGAGKTVGATTSVTLEGLLFTGSGNNGLPKLLSLESGLRAAFIDGGTLTISCGSTNSVFSGGKVSQYSANKTDNNWTTTIDYSIQLQFENSVTTGNIPTFYVSSTQDEWSIETLDETSFSKGPFGLSSYLPGYSSLSFNQGANYPFYRITRTLGAVGKSIPTTSGATRISAVKSAKDWVGYQLGEAPTYSGIVGLKLYNFVRSLSVSENEGSFRITDNWIGVPSGVAIPYIETFSIESSVDQELLRTVTIQGTIKGLELMNSGNIYNTGTLAYLAGSLSNSVTQLSTNDTQRDTIGTKFINALSGYSDIRSNNVLYNRISSAMATGNVATLGYNTTAISSGLAPINPLPMSITEGLNPAEGTITYSWTFNNRPKNLVTGAISETLSIDDRHATPIIASVFILGRRLGPILQDLGTFTSSSRTVSFEVVLPKPSSLVDIVFPTQHYATITGVVERFNPASFTYGTAGAQGIKAYVTANTSNWNPKEGRLSTNKTWEWVKCIE
jgi:hypothetical protein